MGSYVGGQDAGEQCETELVRGDGTRNDPRRAVFWYRLGDLVCSMHRSPKPWYTPPNVIVFMPISLGSPFLVVPFVRLLVQVISEGSRSPYTLLSFE